MFSALTFNMQNGQVWDEHDPDRQTIDVAASAEFLRAQNADVLILQEVEQGFEGGRQVHPPPNFEFLKKNLPGYDSVFAYPQPNPDEIPFGLGLAIFSRAPLRNFRRVDLPPARVTFEFGGRTRQPSHRLLIHVDTEIAGRTIRLFNTHLQAFFMINASSDENRAQRDLVEAELRACPGAGLLGGDFNSAPGESVIEQFAGAGFHSSQTQAVTWRRMPFVVDHLLFNSGLRLECCEVVPTLASDHHAVRGEYAFE